MRRRGLLFTLLGFVLISVLAAGGTLASGRNIRLGLDLSGGLSVVLAPAQHVPANTVEQAVTIINKRVNGLGVSNADVQRQGQDVVISLPGIKNSQEALKTLGTTAELYFRPVYCQIPDYVRPTHAPHTAQGGSGASSGDTAGAPAAASSPQAAGPANAPGGAARLDAAVRSATPTTVSAAGGGGSGTGAAAGSAATTPATAPAATTPTTPTATAVPITQPTTATQGQNDCSAANVASFPSTPSNQVVADRPVIVPAAATSGFTNRFILGPADLTGRAVKTAFTALPQGSNTFAVELTFTSEGTKQFNTMAGQRFQFYDATATTPSVQNLEAIELDGVLESAPQIQSATFPGNAQITGNFTQDQANNLSDQLKYGSLPVHFDPQQVQTISATVGRASLRAGLIAGLVGIIAVLIYMLIYYRGLGLVVLVGMLLTAALLYAILAALSQSSNLTLTLSGVTGIIVAIGITVDSYVVYFERLKDEVRSGRTVRQSVERSFARAFRTVLTADAVSFIAAFILYLLTVGDVRGFAFTLGLATLLTAFAAYFFIRPAVILLGRWRSFAEAPVVGIAHGLGAAKAKEKVGADV